MRRVWKHAWRLVAAGALAAVAGGMSSCTGGAEKAAMRQVSQPRTGRAVGGRVAVVYSREYQIDLGGFERMHSFDIHKYAKIYRALVASGALAPADVFVPEPVTDEQVLRVHTPAFLASLGDSAAVGRYLEQPKIGKLPAGLTDAAIVRAFRHATGGTVLAGRLAMQHGVAVNLAGGYHHAKPAAGDGFCIYNDIAIALRELRAAGLIRRALVVDLDVHQGNGTAVCFAGDESVFTLSLHEGDIYPVPKATSDLDIELPAGTGDEAYLRILRQTLPGVFAKARPDVVVLQAGCDTLAGDPLARLRMTPTGIVRRDASVIDECVRRRVPVVMTLGGGYSRGAWRVQQASVLRTLVAHGAVVPAAAGGGARGAGKGKAVGKSKGGW